jgi:hypothetical protein
MTFDEQLKRAFDTLSDRLRDEIDRQVQAALDEVSASARAETDAAVAAAKAALPAPAPAEVPAAEADVPRDTTTDAAAAGDGLLDAVRALDRAGSLTAILDTLVERVAQGEVGAGIWLVRGGHLREWRTKGIDAPPADVPLDDPGAPAEAARTNAPASGDGFAVPLALAGQVVAVLFARQTGADPGARPNPESHVPNPAVIEVLARHAARCLESATAFRTARAMTDGARAGTAHPSAPAPASPPADAAASEEHASAQRYARLLVSEIRLYHEQAVAEGRRDRDLATRLGGEIARARVMYDQRVPVHVRERADYFHDELVRTLADGDASLLELRT